MEAAGFSMVALEEREPAVLYALTYNELPRAWDMIASLLEKACAHSMGDFTPLTVVDGMRDGLFTLLVWVDAGEPAALAVVSVERTDAHSLLFVNLLGGRMSEDWSSYMPALREFSHDMGCGGRVRAIGRKGLTKKLPDWKVIGVVLEMAGDDGP